MSDAAAVTAAPAKASKKRAGGAAKAKKHSADHPTYSEMIKAALGALKVCDISLHYSAVLHGTRFMMLRIFGCVAMWWGQSPAGPEFQAKIVHAGETFSRFGAVNCTKMRLAAGLRPDPLWEL